MTQSNEDINKEEKEEVKIEKSELDTLKEALSEANDKYLRVLAELDNVKKREDRARVEIAKFAITDFAREIVSVLDIFKKALSGVDEANLDTNTKNLFAGIKMTEKLLEKALNQFGIVEINPLGEKLDPHFHETLYAKADSEKEDGTIVEVIELGYKIHDRILRSAKVGIIKN
ncbi:MAG: nucleotide exchange factor GrpE [Alphaproteobacteria bacterium]|jgi:molecular chaperone GrpE|nr:nucleotide exchange factor GrpE [Alphaproteobacteria bacterium]